MTLSVDDNAWHVVADALGTRPGESLAEAALRVARKPSLGRRGRVASEVLSAFNGRPPSTDEQWASIGRAAAIAGEAEVPG